MKAENNNGESLVTANAEKVPTTPNRENKDLTPFARLHNDEQDSVQPLAHEIDNSWHTPACDQSVDTYKLLLLSDHTYFAITARQLQ